MRLFTRDADGKPDTPLSIWIGLIMVITAVGFEAARIGPGGLGLSWELGVNSFFLLAGLSVLIPGILLTALRSPE